MLEIRHIETDNQYKDIIAFLYELQCDIEFPFLIYFDILKKIYDLDHTVCFENKLIELYDIKINIDSMVIDQKKYFLLEFELINMRFFTNIEKYLDDVYGFLNSFLINNVNKKQRFELYTNNSDVFDVKIVYTSIAKYKFSKKYKKLDFNYTRNLHCMSAEQNINLDHNSNKLFVVIGYRDIKITYYELVVIMLIKQILSGGYSSILSQILREEKQICYNIDSLLDLETCRINLQLISSEINSIELFTQLKKVLNDFTEYLSEDIVKFYKDKLINYVLENINLKEKIKIDLIFNGKAILESKLEQIKALVIKIEKSEIIRIFDKLEIISACSDGECQYE